MILILRGHIRDAFRNNNLLNLIKDIYVLDSNLKIYIHTWNIFANNISWRHIEPDNKIVTKEIIYNYFNNSGLEHLLENENIIIDDDTKIELIGNLKGTINNGVMPIIGWKNYWYGKYKIIKHIYDKNINENELIINLRFDILNNSNNNLVDINNFIKHNFIKHNLGVNIIKNIFIKEEECGGIDNIYIGNIKTLYKLTHYFYYCLDEILCNNNDTIHQEFLVYRLNNRLIY
jgi:hypothetical protein